MQTNKQNMQKRHRNRDKIDTTYTHIYLIAHFPGFIQTLSEDDYRPARTKSVCFTEPN